MKYRNISILAILLMAGILSAAPWEPQVHEDRFLICLKPDVKISEISTRDRVPSTGLASLDQMLTLRDIGVMERWLLSATEDDIDGDICLANIYRLKIDPERKDLESLIEDFKSNEYILFAEYETKPRVSYIPNDPSFDDQWYMKNAKVAEAWDLWDIQGGDMPGNHTIVLASVDSGVDYIHPDLSSNTWVNQGEIPDGIFASVDENSDGYITADEVLAYLSDYNADGVVNLQDALHADSPFMDGIDGDDWDSNAASYVDDLFGWDLAGATDAYDPDNDPMAFKGDPIENYNKEHGTHVAGLLAAVSDNGTGIASTVYNGSVMAVKCGIDDDFEGYIWDGYDAILYAAKAGADIINASWGSFSSYSSSVQGTINVAYTYGALIVAAAGNGNNDGTPNDYIHYPSAYDNVVSVTAVGPNDNFGWATYGSTVDLSAPGENMYSTIFTKYGSYDSWDGTSMASPFVASCFGLVKSLYPDKSNDWLVENMLISADPIDDVNDEIFAGGLGAGRVNVYTALARLIYPRISYDSHSLDITDTNGDGQLSQGETTMLRVVLKNELNWLDAAGITATLSTNRSDVTIQDGNAAYGDIPGGNIGINIMDMYEITLAADASATPIPFELLVTANTDSDNPYETIVEFEVDVTMWQSDFPAFVSQPIISGNAVLDVNYDGEQEIIFGGKDSLLHMYHKDGTEVTGFPVNLGHEIYATPAVADIDDDGMFEIVVPSKDKNVYVIQHDGTVDTVYTSSSYLYATASLEDLDNDGDLEIIFPGYNKELTVIHHDGSLYENFPVNLGEYMIGPAAIADIDGDGAYNIIVGTLSKYVHAIDLSGNELSGFPVMLGDRIYDAPSVADIDFSNDGHLEILIGSNDENLYAINSDGSILWTYSDALGDIQVAPAICDLEGDGDFEIIFGSIDSMVYALDHTGALLTGWPVKTGGPVKSSPIVGDIDNDNILEIFIGSDDGSVYGFELNGESVSGFPVYVSVPVQGAPTLADLDGDGDMEVIVGADDRLAVVDIPIKVDFNDLAWFTDRGDLQRTGRVPGTPVSVDENQQLPLEFRLLANYPNPFNPSTTISFEMPVREFVSLDILDMKGRHVKTLVAEDLDAGIHSYDWSGIDGSGKTVSTGIYLYRMRTDNRVFVRKMLFLK